MRVHGVAPACSSIAPRDVPFQRYALARLGFNGQADPCPALDDLPVGLAVDFVESVANLDLYGYRPLFKELPAGNERSAAVEKAFKAIVSGDLAPIFQATVLEHRAATGTLSPKKPIETLGAFSRMVPFVFEYERIRELVRSGLETALGYPVHEVDKSDYIHIDTIVADTRQGRTSIVIWLVRTGRMHLCFPRGEDLFLPIDVAWKFMSGQRDAMNGK